MGGGSKRDVGLEMKYYVLNPYKKNVYGVASRKALEVYAESIQHYNWDLAAQIREWVKGIRLAIQEKTETETAGGRDTTSKGGSGEILSEHSPRVVRMPINIEERFIED